MFLACFILFGSFILLSDMMNSSPFHCLVFSIPCILWLLQVNKTHGFAPNAHFVIGFKKKIQNTWLVFRSSPWIPTTLVLKKRIFFFISTTLLLTFPEKSSNKIDFNKKLFMISSNIFEKMK